LRQPALRRRGWDAAIPSGLGPGTRPGRSACAGRWAGSAAERQGGALHKQPGNVFVAFALRRGASSVLERISRLRRYDAGSRRANHVVDVAPFRAPNVGIGVALCNSLNERSAPLRAGGARLALGSSRGGRRISTPRPRVVVRLPHHGQPRPWGQGRRPVPAPYRLGVSWNERRRPARRPFG